MSVHPICRLIRTFAISFPAETKRIGQSADRPPVRVSGEAPWERLFFAVSAIAVYMYSVSVSRTFIAQHYLTVPDPGPEGDVHSHTFTVEAKFRGPELDEYGYLVDIDRLDEAMDETVETFRDRVLNERQAFRGRNPSAEHLGRIFGTELLDRLDPSGATELEIAVQEDDVATVTHERQL